MYHLNNTSNQQYLQIGHEFITNYYNSMIKGVNIAFELFSPDVLCTIDANEFKGSYNWLIKMTKAGISKFEYNDLSGICQPLNNYEILITTKGSLRAINFWNHNISNWIRFNETFIIEKNNIYSIKNYILRT